MKRIVSLSGMIYIATISIQPGPEAGAAPPAAPVPVATSPARPSGASIYQTVRPNYARYPYSGVGSFYAIGVGGSYGSGFGPYYGPGFGPYYGPGFGFYPPVYNGFYSNGLSLYGPPVPTGHATPGVFGGSDSIYGTPPFAGFGLGWFGYRSPSPRPTTNFNFHPLPSTGPVIHSTPVTESGSPSGSVLPSVPMSPTIDLNGPAEIKPTVPHPAECLQLEVRVLNEDVRVFVENHATTQTGTTRVFTSPRLTPGTTYLYEVRAEWQEAGKTLSRTQQVQGKAGGKLVVDFTGPTR